MVNAYSVRDRVPLTYIRLRGGAMVTGLSVTVIVRNALTGALLLSSTAVPEVTAGVYSYQWTHGQTAETECIAVYTVGTNNYVENFSIKDDEMVSRSV